MSEVYWVTFDSQLSSSHHLWTREIRATQKIGFFRQACHVFDLLRRVTAYRGFIRSVMEYCPPVLVGVTTTHFFRLAGVQCHTLPLISYGAVMDTLAVRCQAVSLIMFYRLQFATNPPSLVALWPTQAILVRRCTHNPPAVGCQSSA